MAKRILMRMTATYEYWADPDNYPDANGDSAAMAANDLEGFIENGVDQIEGLVIVVAPVVG